MAFIDKDLLFFDNALVTVTESDIIDLDATGLNNGLGNSPADYVNIEISEDATGALTTALTAADTETGSYTATGVTHTFAADAKAGTGVSIILPKELKQFLKATNATATAGSVTMWIGQRKF